MLGVELGLRVRLRPTDRNKENIVKQEQAKGDVRPDGPGDDTAPVIPESTKH